MNFSNSRISGPAANGDYAVLEPGGVIIGEAFHCVGEDAYRDAEANARLWAKAPDLRAALEAIIKAVEDDITLQEQLVIAHFGQEMPFAKAIEQARAALGEETGG